MLNDTYIRNLKNIVNTAENKEEIIEKVVYLTNEVMEMFEKMEVI